MSTSLSKFYQVRGEDTVTLKVTIGHAQHAVTTVYLGQNQIVPGHRNSLELAIPGSGRELNEKTLYCTTVVADVRTETDETSVTFELVGGVKPFKQTLQESVASEGDVVFYAATFLFWV